MVSYLSIEHMVFIYLFKWFPIQVLNTWLLFSKFK